MAFFDAFLSQEYTFTGVDATFDFRADGTWTGTGTETVTGKWEISADQKTLTLKNDAQPGIKQTSTVTTLDDTNLVLQQQADIASDPTAPFTFDYTVTITMKRL
ncbi:MAG: lipocalin family protein [Bacteroidota bacterium]